MVHEVLARDYVMSEHPVSIEVGSDENTHEDEAGHADDEVPHKHFPLGPRQRLAAAGQHMGRQSCLHRQIERLLAEARVQTDGLLHTMQAEVGREGEVHFARLVDAEVEAGTVENREAIAVAPRARPGPEGEAVNVDRKVARVPQGERSTNGEARRSTFGVGGFCRMD